MENNNQENVFKLKENFWKISFCIGLIAFIAITLCITVAEYEASANKIEQFYSNRDTHIEHQIKLRDFKSPYVSKLWCYYDQISETKKANLFLAKRYNSYGFAFTIFFAVFTIITGILAFVIIKKGWENMTNFYLRSAFLISFFCSTLFGILPVVFVTSQNSEANLNHYNQLSNLQLDIYNLSLDTTLLGSKSKNDEDSLKKIFNKLSDDIKANQALIFNIDLSKVPTTVNPSDQFAF